jgi:hypothetical protein
LFQNFSLIAYKAVVEQSSWESTGRNWSFLRGFHEEHLVNRYQFVSVVFVRVMTALSDTKFGTTKFKKCWACGVATWSG